MKPPGGSQKVLDNLPVPRKAYLVPGRERKGGKKGGRREEEARVTGGKREETGRGKGGRREEEGRRMGGTTKGKG